MCDIMLGGRATQLNVLGEFIAENPSLTKLRLYGCHLGTDDITLLSDNLIRRTTNTLKELDLSGNRIGNDDLGNLVSALTTIGSVKCLDLSRNDLREKALGSLKMLLESKDSTIEELDLSNNSISAEGASSLIKSLKGNNKLRRMNLEDNFSEEGWTCALQIVKGKLFVR
jgi:hypothetical protein